MHPKRLVVLALTALLALGATSCGDDDGNDSAQTTAAATDETASDDTAADDTADDDTATTAGDDASSGGDAEAVGVAACRVIRDIQADLGDDAGAVAYLSQFAIGYSGELENLDPSLSRTVLDSAAQEECPEEHARFLESAEIASLDEI